MTAHGNGLVSALSLFSVCPVPSRHAGAPVPRAVLWLPVVGVLLGAAAMVPALAVWRGGGHGAPLLAAAVVVSVLALLTRGLHLDGLADLADGLGSRRPAAQALAVMKQPDIGPFGVVTVVLALLLQVCALGAVFAAGSRADGLVAVILAAATGRVAAVQAAGTGVPIARGDGFGALVAGTVSRPARVISTVVLLLAAIAASLLTGTSGLLAASSGAAAALGLGGAWLVRLHAVRRLGGVTGDVFGALVEIAATTCLIGLAAVTTWR